MVDDKVIAEAGKRKFASCLAKIRSVKAEQDFAATVALPEINWQRTAEVQNIITPLEMRK